MLGDKQFELSFSSTGFQVWSLYLQTSCYVMEHAKSSLVFLSAFATSYAF